MKKLFYFFAVSLFLTSCVKDDDPGVKSEYDSGVFVINEGQFGSGTGTITFSGYDSVIQHEVFERENNGVVLGNIAHSMIYYDERYYIVINNANKIVVTDKNFKYVGEITGLFYPRYMVAKGQKAYVSQWGENNQNGGVAVINLETLTVTKNIATGNGPEFLLLDGDNLLVPNGGSYNTSTFDNQPDSTISIIDINSESVTQNIVVKYNPNSIVKLNDGYAISGAEKSFGSEDGALFFLKKSNYKITKMDLSFDKNSYGKMRYVSDHQFVVVSGGQTVASFEFEPGSLIQKNTYHLGAGYAVDHNPVNDHIYIADAKDFNQNGEIRVLNKNGEILTKFPAGIIPTNFCFR